MNADLFDEWLDAYLLDELSGEQAAQFRAALATDPAARERFVRRVYVEAHLHRLAGSEAVPPAPLPAVGRRWVLGRLARSRWVAVAAVLVIAIGGVIAFQMSRRNDGDARLTSGSVQTGGRAGDRIRDGETVRVTGPVPAVINLADGSTVTLDPDAQCVFRKGVRGARQVVELAAGGGQFEVARSEGAFRVETAVGSVTVLGTRFTVALRSPQSLFVSVAAGSVRFDGNGESVTLGAGQSRTFAATPDRPPPSGANDSVSTSGVIETVDAAERTFAVAGGNDGPRAFRIGWKTGEWETDVFLDGQKTSFTAAVRAGRQVTVTHRQSGGGVIVLKVEVRSEPR